MIRLCPPGRAPRPLTKPPPKQGRAGRRAGQGRRGLQRSVVGDAISAIQPAVLAAATIDRRAMDTGEDRRVTTVTRRHPCAQRLADGRLGAPYVCRILSIREPLSHCSRSQPRVAETATTQRPARPSRSRPSQIESPADRPVGERPVGGNPARSTTQSNVTRRASRVGREQLMGERRRHRRAV